MTGLLLTLAYAFLFLLIILRSRFFRLEGIPSKAIAAVFLLKILAGLAFFWLYTLYPPFQSTSDAIKYFNDSEMMFRALRHKPPDYLKMLTGIGAGQPCFDHYYEMMTSWNRPWDFGLFNDDRTMIRFNALLRIFSFGVYHVHMVVMCFLVMAGQTGLYRFFAPAAAGRKKLLFGAVFLIPTVVFWSSGVLKEGLLILATGMLLYAFGQMVAGKISARCLLASLSMIFLLAFLRIYILIALIPMMIAYLWVEKTGGSRPFLKFLAVTGLFFFSAILFQRIFHTLNFLEIMAAKQGNFIAFADSLPGTVTVPMTHLRPMFSSFLLHLPQAWLNVFLLPCLFYDPSLLVNLAGLENTILILAAVIALIFRRKPASIPARFWLAFFLVLITFTVIGLVTPVLGAMVRYKAPILPFVAVIIVLLPDKDKLLRFLPGFRKTLNNCE